MKWMMWNKKSTNSYKNLMKIEMLTVNFPIY